ncbi:MAG: T9SS type A sorting domain-containing protein [Bacteroidales bacterium]|nr:T9SS type A sorting domain-containing protein [Candidatus Latescibacterota bacterium]
MRNRSIVFTACALLLFVALVPVAAHAGTGSVTCAYEFHQSYGLPDLVNDLHLSIRIDSDSELLSVNWVGADPPASAIGYTMHGDGQGFDVDMDWATTLPYCTMVKVRINITLKGTVCTNQQELEEAYWTYNGGYVGPAKFPPHKWRFLRRYFTPGGELDVYPFELINNDLVNDLYVRGLEFGLLHFDLEDNMFTWDGWDAGLYTGGDFAILPSGNFGLLLTTERWVYPPHVYGHWEFWSGIEPADSLLGEAWIMHYDHEPSTATQMGTFEVLYNGNGSRTINWTTESEGSMAGFNVYRTISVDSERLMVNSALIPARGSDVNGADYSVVDAGLEQRLDCFYWIEGISVDGENSMHGPFLASGKEESPVAFTLSQNYPNPFNPNTTIEYNLVRDCHVKLDIYNIAGQRIVTLKDQGEKAGPGVASWNGKDFNGSDVVSGVYFYKLTVGGETQYKKMILMR